MKIGILTLPLNYNYGGGLLQAYALQKFLKELGHDVWIIDRQDIAPFWQFPLEVVKGLFRKCYFRHGGSILREDNLKAVSINTRKFIDSNMMMTVRVGALNQFHKLRSYGFDAYVVGSDQVWRPDYAPGLYSYFFDFLEENRQIRKFSYAASFGVDEWRYNPSMTERCCELITQFDGVSVRESSGVELCKKYLGVEATKVLDPTFLIDKAVYQGLVHDQDRKRFSGKMVSYVLDMSSEKNVLINYVSNLLGLQCEHLMPNPKSSRSIYPSVSEFISAFVDAEFVITDSYHGTLFSIIFNKPFIVIGNVKRGLARFQSILQDVDLIDRLLLDYRTEVANVILGKPIDWTRVNALIDTKVALSCTFLEQQLS